jgi:hypothetical protein
VRTDHYSLKYLLDQRLSTVPQHQWISKLFGFDFTVEYRPGRLNTVADTLSHRDTEHAQDDAAGLGAMCVQSGPTFAFLDDVRRATPQAPEAQDMLQRLAQASSRRRGASTTGCSCTAAASSCPITATCAARP